MSTIFQGSNFFLICRHQNAWLMCLLSLCLGDSNTRIGYGDSIEPVVTGQLAAIKQSMQF